MSMLSFDIKNYDKSEYIFFPACAYNGNRFKSVRRNYSPRFKPEEIGLDMEITITDVPRLEKDGSGAIEVTTGDVSVPCMGMFSAKRKKAMLIFTIQEINGKNLGLSFSEGSFKITYPALRNRVYIWPFMRENKDIVNPLDEKYNEEIPYKIFEFDCESMPQFFKEFLKLRKVMGMDCKRAENISYKEQIKILTDKFNKYNYTEEWGYISVTDHSYFAPGWCGTGISSYALMKMGGELEWERGEETLNFIYNNQYESGFIPSFITKENGVSTPDHDTRILLRLVADILFFTLKHFDLYIEKNLEIPKLYVNGAKKLADAICKLFETYGQLGHYVNTRTGQLEIGNTTSGALAPAGLIKAYQFFNDEKYLDYAKRIAEHYVNRDLMNGYTTAGPGDILQGVDSESAAALLESLVAIAEVEKDKKWLDYAEFAAAYCSSWVVSYNYKFPKDREFARLDIKTTGTVFANIQNKHSAPGICTLSGDSLYRLYKLTGNELYLELFKDICTAISQCMSTDERPVFSWTVPKDPTLHPDAPPVPPEKLPAGFICERVNMSDWETEKCIGGVFNGSTWSEVSNLLKLADIPEELLK